MSIPATGWAVEQGCQHKLPTFARMLLVVLADILGRTGKLCPSIPYLAHRTGMSERTVDKFVGVLVQHGLIAVAKSVGNVTHYVLLRPDTHASLAPVTPARLAGVNGAHPRKAQQEPPQDTTRTPASLAPEPYRTKKEPKTRAEDARENPRLSDSEEVGRKSQPPTPAPAAPQPAAEPPADPALIRAAIERLERDLRMRAYPPRAAVLDRHEQIDALTGRRPWKQFTPDQLAAARRFAAVPVGASP